jgi:hypothetical protein
MALVAVALEDELARLAVAAPAPVGAAAVLLAARRAVGDELRAPGRRARGEGQSRISRGRACEARYCRGRDGRWAALGRVPRTVVVGRSGFPRRASRLARAVLQASFGAFAGEPREVVVGGRHAQAGAPPADESRAANRATPRGRRRTAARPEGNATSVASRCSLRLTHIGPTPLTMTPSTPGSRRRGSSGRARTTARRRTQRARPGAPASRSAAS